MKILITGVSRGLGQALVREFTELGHSVAGCARDTNAISTLASEVPNAHLTALDLCDDSAVQRWIATLEKDWGIPDLVINNAASINRNAPLWEVPLDEFEKLMAINITAVFSVIRHVLPSMINRGSGVIANISSGWGRSVSADVAPYCATKWAIEGMTQALAQELPQGLSAVPVNPGVINTEMLQSCFGESAHDSPKADEWVKRAAPFFLELGVKDNGVQRSI